MPAGLAFTPDCGQTAAGRLYNCPAEDEMRTALQKAIDDADYECGAAVLRNDALRVVLEWLRCELPWCLTWAPVLGSLHRWQQASTPNRLRRYEGAAHAERCSRPIVPHGELSTWAFIWLACLWLACLWRLVDGSTHQYWRNAKTWCAPQAYRRIAGHMTCANVDFKPGNPYPDPYPYPYPDPDPDLDHSQPQPQA